MSRNCYLLLIACFVAVAPGVSQTTFTYQGRLTQNGAIIQGPTTRMLTFQLCDALTGGSILSNSTLNVTVLDSLFSAELAFPTTVFDGSQRWLQIRIGDVNGAALSPRQKITGVPYAIYALKAAAGNSLTAADGDPAAAVYVNNDGWVGIGTTSPAADLHVRAPSGDTLAEFRIGPGVSESNSQLYLSENITGSFASIIRHNGADNRLEFLGVNGGAEVGPNMMVRRDSGFVGLGTADNPVARLHVNGDSIWLSGTDSGSLGSAAGTGLRLYNTATEAHIYGYDYTAGAARDLVLQPPGGNVGIGVSPPPQKLSVGGTIQSTTGGFMFPDGTLQTSAASGGGGYWSNNGNNIFNNNSGYVGIGTGATAPTALLHVRQSITGSQAQPAAIIENTRVDGGPRLNFSANDNLAFLHLTADAAVDEKFEISSRNAPVVVDTFTHDIRFVAGSEDRFVFEPGLSSGSGGLSIYDTNEQLAFRFSSDGASAAGILSMFASDGATESVHIIADEGDGAAQLEMRNGAGTTTVLMDSAEGTSGGGAGLKLYNGSGARTIDIDADVSGTHEGYIAVADPSDARRAIILDSNNNGSARVTTQVLEITGGSDLSEQFDISTIPEMPLQPGMVVVIDDEQPGKLRVATEAYDPRIAGVISGAGGVQTGLLMGQKGSLADGARPVALTGRVFVLVDASVAPVRPGDLLTTSSLPGHAMKVTDWSAARGAILGKAMGKLENGQGLVLMLVNLQ